MPLTPVRTRGTGKIQRAEFLGIRKRVLSGVHETITVLMLSTEVT